MVEMTKKKWLQQGNLLYRLHDGVNFDQIRVTQVNGVSSVNDEKFAEKETTDLKHILESYNDLYDALDAVFPHIVIPTDGPDMDEAGEVGRKAIKALAKARGENE